MINDIIFFLSMILIAYCLFKWSDKEPKVDTVELYMDGFNNGWKAGWQSSVVSTNRFHVDTLKKHVASNEVSVEEYIETVEGWIEQDEALIAANNIVRYGTNRSGISE